MGRAWAFHRSLDFSSAEGQLSQVLALNGCPKEADDSGRPEPDLAKPEGRASHRFPRAGLDSCPYSHQLIPAVWCHVHQVFSIGEGKGDFHRGAWKGLLSSLLFPFATLAILLISSLHSHSPFLLSLFFFHIPSPPFIFITSLSPFHFALTQCHPFFLSASFSTLPFYLPIPSPARLAASITLMFSVPSPTHITSSLTPELSYSPHSFTNKRFWFCTAASRIEKNGT